MEVYKVEAQIVERKEILEQLADYVNKAALDKPMHEVERDLRETLRDWA